LRAGPPSGGISKTEDLVYIWLLEKGNGGSSWSTFYISSRYSWISIEPYHPS